jgi:hypothetical protein
MLTLPHLWLEKNFSTFARGYLDARSLRLVIVTRHVGSGVPPTEYLFI